MLDAAKHSSHGQEELRRILAPAKEASDLAIQLTWGAEGQVWDQSRLDMLAKAPWA